MTAIYGMKITVGTRGSFLSIIQTQTVIALLRNKFPSLDIELKTIRTLGDEKPNQPFSQFKSKGIFEKEIDRAVANGDVDFAVHSMKDVPILEPRKVELAAIPKRESPNDVLISRGNKTLNDLPPSAVIGTSSPRRKAQLKHFRADLTVKPLRGNVDTRLKKLARGLYEGIILAEAGVKRMNLNDQITQRLDLHNFTPSPGQGALGLVASAENSAVIEFLSPINHPPSMTEVAAERAMLARIGGGCHIPVGAVGRARRGKLTLFGMVLHPNGSFKLTVQRTSSIDGAVELGGEVGDKLLSLGAKELLKETGEG